MGTMPPIHHHTKNRFGYRSLLACLVFGAGTYILVVIAAYHTQSAIIFSPGGLMVTPPTGFPIETVSIPTPDGLRLNGWWLPTRYLLKFHFRNGAKLQNVQAPIIIIHSPDDGYIPFAQGQRRFDEAPEPKVLLTTTGHHLELFDRQPDYRQQFARHLDRLTHNTLSMTRLP